MYAHLKDVCLQSSFGEERQGEKCTYFTDRVPTVCLKNNTKRFFQNKIIDYPKPNDKNFEDLSTLKDER